MCYACPVSSVCCVFGQYEETQSELSDLKEKYKRTEQEKQSITEELDECKADMKGLQDKGSSVSSLLPLGRGRGIA